MKIEHIKRAKNIAIIWFWKEGKATFNFLKKIGCENVSVLDRSEISDDISDHFSSCITWSMYLDDLESFDLIIKSVGISPYQNKQLQNIKAKTTTATEIFFSNYTWKIIGITGTKGKSTTSSLCHHVLQSLWYKTALLWNIWNPALDVLDESYEYVIYELSSYMLEKMQPDLEVWVLINIFPDHLDWYDGNFELYKEAKQNILSNAKIKIINHNLKNKIPEEFFNDSIHYNQRDKDINFHEWSYYIWDHAIFTHEGIHLEWEHNMENITCVLSILRALKIEISDIKNILTNFCALPHRLQDVWIYNWIRFINDSISTTPESTIEAIKTYKDSISTLFLWWTDRWYSFTELIASVKKYNIKNIVLFPESSEKIKNLLNQDSYNILETTSMSDAVEFAYNNTETNKICLLSTASPSYSIWKNFEEQWNEFQKFVKEHQ